jgi:putative aldouronate transport system substrate-binding protein
MKKTLSILLAALMLLCVLPLSAGAAENEEARALAEKYGLPLPAMADMEPAEFTIFNRGFDMSWAADNEVIKIIETITNTKITVNFLVGDEQTKIGTMIASNIMEDGVFVGGTTGPFIDAGCFIPLEDLIEEHAPHLRAHYDPWWNYMKHSDGHIYIAELFGTPVGDEVVLEHWGSAMWLQKDVLDHFGRAPETLDEYFDFIREYMEIYPAIDGVPTRGFEVLATGFKWIDNPPLFLNGQPNWGAVWVDEETDIAYDRFTADFAKDWFRILNKEFAAGVVPADTLTLTQDQYLANIASGAVLGFHDQMWAFNTSQDSLKQEGKFNRTYLPLSLTFPGKEPNYADKREFTGNNGLGISSSCKDPVRFIQFMDYIIQEPVQKFLTWGIEGEHHIVVDGRLMRTQEQRELQNDQRWVKDHMGKILYDNMPKMQGSFSDGNATEPGQQPEEYFASLREYDRQLFEKLGIKIQGAYIGLQKERPVYYPVWSMTIEDGTPAKLAEQRSKDIREVYYAKAITAAPEDFDAVWDEYVKEYENANIEVFIEEINRQIQERIQIRGN